MATTILVKQTNGTTLGVVASLPATYDGTGYNALTFVSCGEILSIGEISKTYSVLSHQSVGRAYPLKIKDTYDISNVSFTMARVSGDAGQDILQTAIGSATSISFKITLPSGATEQFTGKVIKIGLGAVAPSGVETIVMDVSIDVESLYETGI